MNTISKQTLFWTPRILCILFALFMSLFALDVFGEGRGFWETVIALHIHLIPVYVVGIVLTVAWRWEWVGAVGFVGLAVLYVVWAWGRFPLANYIIMAGPLVVVAVLFLFNWILRAQIRAN
jgi:hypothetical protein